MAETTPIPAAKKEDSEDVSWALSTAEAMWNRGDKSDAVKWLRKAVEAASEAQDDDRALELAKAAADLATQVGPIQTGPPPPVTSAKPSVPPPRSSPRSVPPPPPSRPAPPPPPSSKPGPPQAAPLTGAPPRPPGQPRVVGTAPRPPLVPSGAKGVIPPIRPAAGVPAKPRGRKSSQASLNEEAKRADAIVAANARPAPPAPTPLAPGDVTITQGVPDEITQQIQVAADARKRARTSKPAQEELAPVVHAPVTATTDEMDAWPTQSLTGDGGFGDNDEQTRVGEPAYQENMQMTEEREPMRADPALRHSQAVRVVVWRASDGVRVAPYGTTVNAIGVDALLVALDPNADLATWLSRK